MRRFLKDVWFRIRDWTHGGSRSLPVDQSLARTLRDADANWGSGFSGMNKDQLHNLIVDSHEAYTKSMEDPNKITRPKP